MFVASLTFWEVLLDLTKRFGRHSSREGDIELAVSKTLVVEIDPRLLERLTLGLVDGHGPA